MIHVPARVGAVAAVLMSASALAAPAAAPSQIQPGGRTPVAVNGNGTVSVRAEGIQLRALLEAMQPVCAMDLRVDEKQGARIVSVELVNLTPSAAVNEVLKASGADFGMNTQCGTAAHPMRVVLRNGSTAPIVARGGVDPDDPRVKNANPPPPLPGDPTPKPERRDEDPAPGPVGVVGAAASGTRELAPGEVTGEMLLQKLAPQPKSNEAVIELPFTDANGQPYLQVRPPASRTVVLPFPDANGNLVEVPAPTGQKPAKADFPVVNGPNAAPAATPAAAPKNPADGQKRPGPGGSDR